jgi:hypothetical protein
MKTTNNEEILNTFLEYAKKDSEYLAIKTYTNSVIVYFDRSILTDVFKKLIDLELDFFTYRSIFIDPFSNQPCICLFIYKKKYYDFN